MVDCKGEMLRAQLFCVISSSNNHQDTLAICGCTRLRARNVRRAPPSDYLRAIHALLREQSCEGSVGQAEQPPQYRRPQQCALVQCRWIRRPRVAPALKQVAEL